jgi:hypothetical protein
MAQIINFEELQHLNIDFDNSALGCDSQRSQLIYQVFFLPSDDVNNPSDFTAFCPFTKFWAHGTTILEAAQNWTNVARKKIQKTQKCQSTFCLPRYCFKFEAFPRLVYVLFIFSFLVYFDHLKY